MEGDRNQPHGCILFTNQIQCENSSLKLFPVVHPELHFIGKNVRASHFDAIHPKLKLALNIRDETCCFPGCRCKKYVDYHHILFWSHDGFTDPDNLIKLCRFHHALLHQGHYYIQLREQTDDNHQKWIFKTPEGLIIEPSPTLPPVRQDYKDTLPPIPKKIPSALKRMFDYQYTKKMLDESKQWWG